MIAYPAKKVHGFYSSRCYKWTPRPKKNFMNKKQKRELVLSKRDLNQTSHGLAIPKLLKNGMIQVNLTQ